MYFSYFKSKQYYLSCTNFQYSLTGKIIDSKRKKAKKKTSERPKKEKTIGYPNLQKTSIFRVDSLINM